MTAWLPSPVVTLVLVAATALLLVAASAVITCVEVTDFAVTLASAMGPTFNR